MSKNNPEKRGRETEARKHKGQKVLPVRFVDPTNKRNYIAGQYEGSGDLVMDAKGVPIPYQKI